MPAEEPLPLTPEDRAILDLETDRIAGHTCKVVRVGGAVAPADLRDSIAERLPAAPLLGLKLAGSTDAPEWVPDTGFELARHVTEAPRDSDSLEETVASIFAGRLERDRPLWHLDLVAGEGETALVWRIHHALADGMTTMRMAEAVLFDAVPDPKPEEASSKGAGPGAVVPRPSSSGHAGFLRREFGRSVRRGPFDAAPGRERSVAFATVAMGPLHDAARRLADATLNDAVLVSVAGGVRRWLARHHGHEETLRIKVPVSLHSNGDDLGNHDSFFIVGVPLHEEGPAASLAAVNRETTVRKQQHDAQEMDSLLQHLGGVSPGLTRLVDRLERTGRAFALNVSNVPGPARDLSVLGAPVTSFHSLAEIAPHHSLRVAVVSAGGTLNFGLVADPAVVDDLAEIAAGIEHEAASIVAA